MAKNTNTVSIPKIEYAELLNDRRLIDLFYDNGIEDWDGFDLVMTLFESEKYGREIPESDNIEYIRSN